MNLLGEDWPVFGWSDDMRLALASARRRDRAVALATIVALEGSAPRHVGTQMVLDGAQATGHFSGGCVEADLANHAARVVHGDEPALLTYGANSPWLDIRLVCGSRMQVLVERIAPDDPAIASLLDLAARRIPALFVTDGLYRTATADDGSSRLSFTGQPLRLELPYEPPARMVVVGGDPTALAIARLAAQSGFETILLRPDGPGSPPPFDIAGYRRGAAAAELEAIAPDRWTALAIAIHEPELEHRLLEIALRGEAGYVGVLGAAARVPARRARLEQAGLCAGQVGRLRAPMGLVTCGKSPWEVAVSVMAEVVHLRAERRLDAASSDRATIRAAIR